MLIRDSVRDIFFPTKKIQNIGKLKEKIGMKLGFCFANRENNFQTIG